MIKKRIVAILVGLGLIVVGAMRPQPARADATTTGLLIAAGAIGAYALFLVIATSAIYGPPSSSLAEQPDVDRPAVSPAGPRFGPGCPPASANLPLVCW